MNEILSLFLTAYSRCLTFWKQS